MPLNDKQIRAAKVESGEQLLSDGGGLYLRIRPESKVWFYRYTIEGKAKKLQLGVFPQMPLADARSKAAVLTGERRQRLDPVAERDANEAARRAELLAANAAANRLTVRSLFQQWEKTELSRRKDKGAETRRCFEKDVFPTLGEVAAEDVRRAMVAACLDKVVAREARILARNILGDLRQMFGFAIKRSYVENDPTSHLKRDDFGKKVERDRFLDEGEIKKLNTLLPHARMKASGIAAIWVMLSTLCRVGELSGAEWKDVDLGGGVWRIPPDNSKNAKEHTIYLSEFAKVHFVSLKKLATDEDNNLAQWVMPASHRDGPVCVKSLTKQVADRQRDRAPMKNRTNLTTALILPRGKWVPHDLRRSGATLMGELGVRTEVIEKCLNHTPANSLVRTYQRQTLVSEQKDAWMLLGERLELLTSKATNVVILNQAA